MVAALTTSMMIDSPLIAAPHLTQSQKCTYPMASAKNATVTATQIKSSMLVFSKALSHNPCRNWARRVRPKSATPLRFAGGGEIARMTFVLWARRVQFQQCQPRRCHHPSLLFLRHFLPGVGHGFACTSEVRSQGLVVMMEKLRQLFSRYV